MRRLALVAAVLALVGPRALPVQADDAGPVTVFDAAQADARVPKAQGASVAVATTQGKAGALVTLPAGGSWGRVWWTGVPKDVRAFAHLDLELLTAAGEPAAFDVSLADGDDRSAVLRAAAPKPAWESRRLDLGDFNPEPGFDPADVRTLTLTWRRPANIGVALAKVAFVPGPSGWRHPPEELMKRVFGAQRAREVKREKTAHFELFSDSAKALTSLGQALEKDAEAITFQLGAAPGALEGFTLPVYAFKQASDYQEYCVRVLGMSEQLARSYTATGTSWALIMVVQSSSTAAWRHRLARAITAHLYGAGGGAWFHDGAAELCVRRLSDRPVAKEMAARVKAGTHWTLAQLLGASRLHAASDQTDASYDHRPVYLHAASVVEFLLAVPPPGPEAAAEKVQARFKALGAMAEQGKARVEALPKVLGFATLEEAEGAWKAWIATAGRK